MPSKRIPNYVYYRGHWVPVISMGEQYMSDCLGQYDHDRMQMWLYDGMSPSIAENTFIHECIELINYADYLKMEHDLITRLGNSFYQLLKENDIHLYYKLER